jgi:ATP-dependent protease ClpP protease subunit
LCHCTERVDSVTPRRNLNVLAGEEAVRYGIIDAVGGLTDALDALRGMIKK